MTYPQTYTKVLDDLKAITDAFLHDGVFIIHLPTTPDDYGAWRKRVLLHPPSMRKFARTCAKDLKRPFLWAEVGKHRFWDRITPYKERPLEYYARLIIPRRKYLEPVAGSLLLTMDDRSLGEVAAAKSPLWAKRRDSVMTFYFRGDKGKVLFETWLAQCRTNPEFRKALKLLTE